MSESRFGSTEMLEEEQWKMEGKGKPEEESRGNSMRDLSEKSGIWVSKIFFFSLEAATLCVRVITRMVEMEKRDN